MDLGTLYASDTNKTSKDFARDLVAAAAKKGFMIHNEDKMQMAEFFRKKGCSVADDFDLHMVQICKPEKASASLHKNPERAAFLPKHISFFTSGGKTQIRFYCYGRDVVESFLNSDPDFSVSLQESCKTIISIIEDAKN
ncbi:MAG: DUF302 domain-containing protein [Dissulfurispiraceae bacterium]|jgi:uncharacterized protein (DUF302 family)|nr:DUF302 domain-containing protein [Dissulfurispiraceae bacterium]